MNTNLQPADSPLIPLAAEEPHDGKLATLFAEARGVFGMVPNAARLLGVSPPLLERQLHFINHYRDHPHLSPGLLAFLRLLVAQTEQCGYCVDMNTALLTNAGVPLEAITEARREPGRAPLPKAERALLLFVIKALEAPREVSPDAIAELHRLGWSDADLVDAVHHGAIARATDIQLEIFRVPTDSAFTG